jgi:hypothetical protein
VTDQSTVTTPPAAFPAPATATWGQGAAPAPAQKRKPGHIVVAAGAAVGVIGGALGLIGMLKDEPKVAAAPGLVVTAPDPTLGPAIPDAPAPLVAPGPQVPASVVTTTIPPATTTTQAPAPAAPTGDEQTVTGDITVAVPGGWDVTNSSDGFVLVETSGAQFRVVTATGYADSVELAQDWVNKQMDEVQNLTITDSGAASLPSANVVSGYSLVYEGVLATQQGTLPVESVVLAYVTQDGVGVVLETFNAKGDFGSYGADYGAMTDSVVRTL